jgi:hypothetical protein
MRFLFLLCIWSTSIVIGRAETGLSSDQDFKPDLVAFDADPYADTSLDSTFLTGMGVMGRDMEEPVQFSGETN